MSGRFLRPAYSIVAVFLGVGSGTAWGQEELFVTNVGINAVTVYTRTANGNVGPLRTLAGAATGLNGPEELAVDRMNGELVVVNQGNNSVTVYARTANGNIAPLRTIAGAATGLNAPAGVAVDTVNNELVVGNQGIPNSVTIYARTANGNIAPLRTISGAATGLNAPSYLSLDTVNNELLVANVTGNSVTAYARTANGDVAPLRTISGAATGLNLPEDAAVDTVNNELVVTNFGNNSITVYARTANGNVAPLRTISGGATGLASPFGIAVDTVNNELVVGDDGATSVTVYARTANGDVAPLRNLSGAATGLFNPAFAAVTTGANAQQAGLVEDAHPSGDTISNVNNILEPGETVLVNPSWKNTGASPLALTGTASGFSGPAGAVYTLLDSVADYGTIAPGATADSFSAGTGLSYRLEVSVPSGRPATHWDATFLETLSTGIPKTWTLHIGQSFTDVPTSNVSYASVENIFHNGITTGCAAGLYCPAVNLPRWQMAIFLARSILGSGVTIPTSGTVSGVGPYDCTGGISLFTDVAPTNVACPAIHFIYSQGITTGCGVGIFCPNTLLPRWQMAIFLARSMLGPGVPIPTSGTVSGVGPYNCMSGGTSLFTDVAPTDTACPAIHYIYSQGVTTGCAAGLYCPNTLLPRWQMAIFLVRAFQMPFLH